MEISEVEGEAGTLVIEDLALVLLVRRSVLFVGGVSV
jgi:hypothetical protein